MVQHEDIDHTGIPGVGGTGMVGYPVAIGPPALVGLVTATTNNTADTAFAVPLVIPSDIKVRGLTVDITSSAAGSIQWGLFDYFASATAATKVAGGSAAPGGTGYRSIAATGAPVDVSAGNYILIVKQPAATVSTIRCQISAGASVVPWNQVHSSYTWDDTPDLTAVGWAPNSTMIVFYLEGDMNVAGTRWV